LPSRQEARVAALAAARPSLTERWLTRIVRGWVSLLLAMVRFVAFVGRVFGTRRSQ
jgi:hypothetical protein